MERVPQDEQRDRSLFMNKHTVMLLIDPATGAIVDANPAACAFYGYSVDELTTRKITDFNVLPQDDVFRQMQHAAAHERQHFHFRHRVATGELRDVEVDSGAITLDGISLLYSIVTDVTERHRAEQMLQEREARFRALTEHASDLVSVLDAQGIYRYVSPSHRTVLGYAPEELLGTLAFDLVAPADRPRAQAVFASGVVRPSGGVRLELSLRHADDSWRRVGLVGNNRLADPAVQGIILNSRDITEGTRAVEALQVSERHYRQLFEQANDAILVIDPEGEIVLDANARACALYAITRDAFLGTSLKRISQDVPRGDAHLQRLIAEGSYEEFETVQFRADGTPLSLLINASMITFQGRSAVLSVNRDMTARKHAEDTLRTSEQQFRLLFADSPQPMWVYDTQTLRVLEVNEAAVAHYGYTRAEFLALSITDLRPPEDVPRLLETVRTTQPDLRRVEQWRHRLKDGRLIDVEITAHTMAFAGHAAALVLSYDVSARIQAEAERERFFTLSLDLLCIADMAGYFTSVNPAFEQTLGYTPQEICAEPFLSFVHPDDQAVTVAEVAKLATGATTITFENRYRCKDGTYRWLLWTSVPAEGLLYATARDITEHKEADRAIRRLNIGLEQRVVERTAELETAITGLHQQIAERQQAEIALRASELRFRSVTQSAHDAIVVADESGTILTWNSGARALFGYTEAEALGRPLTLVIPPRYREAHRQGLARFLATREARVIGHAVEFQGLRRDGSEFPLELSLATWSTDEGTFFSGNFRDITDRKRAEVALQQAKEEAERANRAKSEFLARVSHELRTPLNAILGFGQVLEMRDLGLRSNEGVGHILKAGRHLLQLIDEVLDIARIETGRMTLSLEPIDVERSVREVLDLTRPLAMARHIELVNELTLSEARYIRADHQRLMQVLLNLVSNAIKYNRSGGQVTLSFAEAPDGRLSLLVRDTGAGLHAAEIERLFVPFERLDAARTGIEGTGIGLALSKQLVEAMGGTIGVDSVVGEGSTFWVELPLTGRVLAQGDQAPSVGSVATESGALPRSYKVLCVEDNLSNIALIEHLLSQVGEVRLLTTPQGRLGLELAWQHRPDLILLDVHLPDIPGDEVLRRLKAAPQTRDIPVVVLSADAVPSHMSRLRDAGAKAYLTKPIDVKQFLQTVRDVLNEGP